MMQSNIPEGGAYNSKSQTNTSRQPIHEVVNTAFDRSDAASQVDPNLVAQITEQVISSLKASGITGGPLGSQTPQFGPQHPQTQIPPLYQPQPINGTRQSAPAAVPPSPSSPASSHHPARYTPPSPTRRGASTSGSSSPEPPSENASYTSREPKSTSRRDSKASASGSEDTNIRSRPRPVRVPSAVEETTLEKIWKPLFDNGKPTPRLGQFLRGLAKHLIEDCEPKQSIVVTPGKLADFFETTKVSDELYPWNLIFGGRLTNVAISRLFRDLRCQHHLVQFQFHDVPTIPGLTPQGFDVFMTTLIQAHPDREFERLGKALRDMPISNADDCKERFPKQLSKRLFPRRDDLQQQQRLVAALSADPAIALSTKNTIPPPPSTQPPSMQHSSSSVGERERNPYSSFSSGIEDEEINTTSFPIERERKPYTAREGGGKVHNQDKSSSSTTRPEPTTARSSRTNSNLPQPQFAPSRPTDIPAPGPRSHRKSMSGAPYGSSMGANRYGTSPPPTNPYTRSEGTNIGDIPASQYASNVHPDIPREPQEQQRRYTRRTTDEEIARGFGVPTRSSTFNGGNGQSQFNTNGNGNGNYGYGSFSTTGNGYGGTDGYGSFPSGQVNGNGYGNVPPPPLGPRY